MPDQQRADEQAPTAGFADDSADVRVQSLGERVLGSLLDRAPPAAAAPGGAARGPGAGRDRLPADLHPPAGRRPALPPAVAGRAARLPASETIRRLSHALMDARSGRTSDDASLLVVEWKQPPYDDELSPSIPEATPTGG